MIHEVCKDIVNNLDIDKFVETGTFLGETVALASEWFAERDKDFGTIVMKAPNERLNSFFRKKEILHPVFQGSKNNSRMEIYSVDTDKEKQGILRTIYESNPNIHIVEDSSEKFLPNAVDTGLFKNDDNFLFYLDAHWDKYWPLREEIRQVLRLSKAVIVIDDAIVPYHPFHGFDAYKTDVCGWYYVRDLFFGRKADVYYPKRANRDGRGTMIIFVGYKDEELAFMEKLPCFKPKIFRGAFFTTYLVKTVFFIFILTGLYKPFLRWYFKKKWGDNYVLIHRWVKELD